MLLVDVLNAVSQVQRDVAREALKVEHEKDVAMILPVMADCLDTLGTFAWSDIGQEYLNEMGVSVDQWLNTHPTMRFLGEQLRSSVMSVDYPLYRSKSVVEQIAEVA